MTVVFHIIVGLNNGGAESVLYRICANIKHVKHVVVSLTDLGYYSTHLRSIGVPVHALYLTPSFISLFKLLTLIKLLRRYKPAIVHTWMYHADLIGGVISRLCGVRNVFWNIRSGLDSSSTKLSTRVFIYICALFSYFIPSRIFCCSHASQLSHIALGYSRSRFILVQNGYDTNFYSPCSISVQQEFLESCSIKQPYPLILGMVARFDPFKDHPTLFHALHYLKLSKLTFVCVLVGSGIDSSNSELCDLLSQYNLNDSVVLLGEQSNIPLIMSSLDLHILSSYSEAFPNVLAEAMACGTPCVSTDVGDASLILGKNGYIVPPSDPLSLSQAVLSFSNLTPSQKLSLSRSSRKHICNQFSLDVMIREYSAAYTDCP